MGPLVNLWGFGPDGIGHEQPPTDEALAAVRRSPSATKCWRQTAIKRVMRKTTAAIYVDLSGWAKGYAVDEIASLLDRAGPH